MLLSWNPYLGNSNVHKTAMLSTFRKWKSKKEKKRKLLIQVIENHHGGEMLVNLEDTLNGILGKAGIDSSVGTTTLDGELLKPGDLDKPLAALLSERNLFAKGGKIMRKRRRDQEIINIIISILAVAAGISIFIMMFLAFC